MWSLVCIALLALASQAAGEGCVCTKELRPVCSVDGVEYANDCLAKCDMAIVAYPGRCKPAACSACSSTWEPVCDAASKEEAGSGVTYANSCFADCNGAKNMLEGNCRDLAGCACLQAYIPVCGADGNTYSHASCASCKEVPVAYEGECKDADCKCDESLDVVCGSDGNSYINPCIANCSGVDYTRGACGSSKAECKRDCGDIDHVWSPTCVAQTPKKDRMQSTTYSSACFAKCDSNIDTEGGRKKGVYYDGQCNLECDRKCAKKGMKPVCCGGKEFPNACYAKCLGNKCPEDDCYSGQCKGKDAITLFESAECAVGSAQVRCFADPCQVTSCPAHPDAPCLANYCTRFFRLEHLEAGCNAYFMDMDTGNLLDCTS